MVSKEEVMLFNKYENQLLEILYHQQDYTTSDLQGVIGAIVRTIYNEGKNSQKK